MEQAPHFGAIPSAGDVQKKKAQQVTDAEWREQFVEELCQPDALLRLQRLEQNDSAKADKVKASALAPSQLSPCCTKRVFCASGLSTHSRVPRQSAGGARGGRHVQEHAVRLQARKNLIRIRRPTRELNSPS